MRKWDRNKSIPRKTATHFRRQFFFFFTPIRVCSYSEHNCDDLRSVWLSWNSFIGHGPRVSYYLALSASIPKKKTWPNKKKEKWPDNFFKIRPKLCLNISKISPRVLNGSKISLVIFNKFWLLKQTKNDNHFNILMLELCKQRETHKQSISKNGYSEI